MGDPLSGWGGLVAFGMLLGVVLSAAALLLTDETGRGRWR